MSNEGFYWVGSEYIPIPAQNFLNKENKEPS